ncbi:MAG TPA: beta-ketoacyl-[acyl-carrier-protein] synthase family protein [Thermodesulfobacteriota bacterium]|nr:beta-ketoacyl-[acyl-carrier-protein] synthase family protein [Thermodesulfobacteriota bacterium]
MEKERVVITGLGTVNAIARNASEFSAALRQGACGIGPISVFDTSDFRTRTGGEVKNFTPRRMIPPEFSLKRMSRSDQMALAAALEALEDAGLFPLSETLRTDTAVVIGGGAGGMLEAEETFFQYLKRNEKKTRYSSFSAFCCASSADRIASLLGLMGPKTTFMTACSSGATAIGFAGDLIREGTASTVIAGGTEPLCRITYAAFNALQAVDREYCKPFDKNRQGISLGEGAGVMILEGLSQAQKRGARIYGEVLGYGVSGDSYHMTAPDPQASGAIHCIKAALRDSGLIPDQIDYINAHGTATPANDLMETRGIKAVFGRSAYRIPVSSTKSMMGHTLGAAGAIEGVACVLGIFHHFIPPTIHLTEPDPECDLDYVSEGSRETELNIVLSNSFAFGGNNTALIFGRYTPKGIGHE